MNSKKSWVFAFVSAVAFMLSLNLVSADFGQDVNDFVQKGVDFVSGVGGPLFSALLGTSGEDSNIVFLKVLSFILIVIVIFGTLDSINLFTGSKNGWGLNVLVAVIVSIIGVRFMPSNMWSSLTAPSSALVATVLVGMPFFALAFISVKIRYNFASKLLWLFYMIFMSYLIFSLSGSDFKWIYGLFLALGAVMLFFDGTVRRFWYKEKFQREVESDLSKKSIQDRAKLREEIRKWHDILADTGASDREQNTAKKEIRRLEAMYGDLESI